MEQEIIYFELNNWIRGKHYPDAEPFNTWFKKDSEIVFNDEDWVKENKLCVVRSLIDMSFNFCITATKEWVLENCSELLTGYREFLRWPDEDGKVYGDFDDEFLEYKEENIGLHNGDW